MRNFLNMIFRKLYKLLKYIAVFIACGLYIWAISILLKDDNWIGISSITTVLLAIAAFSAIRQNYKFREKDRKERLLNEIIEWAESLASWSEKKIAEGLITIYPTQENVLSIIFDRLSKQIDDIEKIKGRNIYILELSKTFHAEIKSSTNNIINQIDTLKEKLLEWKTEIGSKIANGIIVIRIDENDVSKNTDINTCISELKSNAKKVIEEATKIKTQDIN